MSFICHLILKDEIPEIDDFADTYEAMRILAGVPQAFDKSLLVPRIVYI